MKYIFMKYIFFPLMGKNCFDKNKPGQNIEYKE